VTKLLEEALADAQALPEYQQDRLAHFIKRLVRDPETVSGDAYWEMLLADRRSDDLLEILAKEAEEEDARGETIDIDAPCKR
jgi:hypothetical protein